MTADRRATGVIRRVAADGTVVFVGPDADEVGAAVREATAAGKRAAGLVGSIDGPAVARAVDEMVAELFGARSFS